MYIFWHNRTLVSHIAAIVFLLVSCGGNDSAEQAATAEEADQIITSADEVEQARMEGRNAAKAFVGKEWPDTLTLQGALLEARAKQSKYEINNNREASEAFDSAFVSTIRTVRPDVGRHLSTLNADAK